MTKRLLSIALLTLLLLGVPGVASAHVLKIDGNIGAVLHIEPDDDPQSGVPVTYELEFTDQASRFNLSGCKCTVAILQGSHTISTVATGGSGLAGNGKITFPKPGSYTLRASGQPKQTGGFQPFTLNYPVRAISGKVDAQPFPPFLWAGIGLVVLLLLLAAFAMEYSRKPSSEKPES